MFNIGDLVLCEGDNELYLYYGKGSWSGWGNFVRIADGYACQLAEVMCSKWC